MPGKDIITRIIGQVRSKVDEARLPATAKAIRRERLTYLSASKLKRLDQIVHDIVRRGVEGNFVEFGVALGGSAIMLAKLAVQSSRSLHGFDVFGMIPPPSSPNDDIHSKERYDVIASGKSKGIGRDTYYGYRSDLYSDVCAAFARHGVPVNGVSTILHKGLFEYTLPSCDLSRIAFAHIDCDWYDPVKLCLEWTATRLSVEGVIVLDDYHDYGGCRKAADEFVVAHPNFELQDGPNPALIRHDAATMR